ncbi:phosphoribosylamine--glycine ligase [Kurthia sibirica]|uniref:Phosphoribosylamine--glycine ligase n=1 Tax=Kurthia sibirica TaxID=202750 RepID=A0A2U3AL55_9BACL|nr:phosphoribosylamine--glycine ligase [Kurthia sibirica]PWI25239.1 phosphoribosylamine--glycine ligase [Kurthia sibirica]GEK33740.1 phosphoribosylamine--glycine ligase [Kurthia sibirica]
MKVLVIGSGGREHAIVKQFKKASSVEQVFVAPGNDGMAQDATIVPIAQTSVEELITFAQQEAISLTFIGPEQPLTEGIVDAFEAAGLRVFGPRKNAAQIEGSKAFAKELMAKYSIPTAKYATFSDVAQAVAYIKEQGAPIVIKADGLAAGKGVVVAITEQEAIAAVEDMIGNQRFGDSSSRVVIEEFLDGEEFSFMSFVHAGQIYPMVIAQDHKRAYDGDKGPNTGGMGAYSPVPQIPQSVIDEALSTIVKPTVAAMDSEGTPFTGILYAGLILTENGPKVIEFNARFGDPEAQVVLQRMTSDLGEFLMALLDERPFDLQWSDEAVLGVVIAAEGYPTYVEKGHNLPDLTELESEFAVYHAGTKEVYGNYCGNGGRVLLVTAKGASLKEAQAMVYTGLDAYQWPKFFYRHDIGWRIVDQ